jgi:hypothetical protein
MALDAIFEVVVRIIVEFVVEVLFVGVFYWPGWIILRVLTLGRYPPSQSYKHNREFVSTVTLITLIAGVTVHYSNSFV